MDTTESLIRLKQKGYDSTSSSHATLLYQLCALERTTELETKLDQKLEKLKYELDCKRKAYRTLTLELMTCKQQNIAEQLPSQRSTNNTLFLSWSLNTLLSVTTIAVSVYTILCIFISFLTRE